MNIADLFIYRWRYWLGYGAIAIALIIVLVFAGLHTPGGITIEEKNSVISSASIGNDSLSTIPVIHLPYHLLQKASITLLGVSDISVKLPSLVIALFSAVGLVLLLRRWFRQNVAVLGSIIAITTGQFLFIAQDGTPGIIYVFWSVWLLFIATLVAKKRRPRTFFKVLFFVMAALSLYTPLSIYVLLALVSAILLHPHLRYLVRTLSKIKIAIGFIAAAIVLIPFAWGIIQTPSLAVELFGIQTVWPDIGANLALLGQQLFGFMSPSQSGLLSPMFGLGSMALIVYGAYRLLRSRDTVQSYTIITWVICLLPILVLNPDNTVILFVPLVLLLATGLTGLFHEWYRLFPRNPYARLAGLVPLVILVGVLVLSGIERYQYTYQYNPDTATRFSHDLSLIPNDTKKLVVSTSEKDFYEVVAAHKKDFVITTQTPNDDMFTATREANRSYPGYTIERIITSPASNDSDRLYIYKKSTQ